LEVVTTPPPSPRTPQLQEVAMLLVWSPPQQHLAVLMLAWKVKVNR
jgi:hypothetical protein